MEIIYNPIFEQQAIEIVEYIAQDKPSVAIEFALTLEQKILQIPDFPFQYRPSNYFDNSNIRDMIYKKHTIVYEVNLENNTIEILQIFNRNKPQ